MTFAPPSAAPPSSLSTVAERVISALTDLTSERTNKHESAVLTGHKRGLNTFRSLIASGVSVETLERSAWLHMGFRFVDVSADMLEPNFFDSFPLASAKELAVLPMGSNVSGALRVAVASPDDLELLDNVRRIAPGSVEFVAADASAIAACLASVDHRAASNELMEELPLVTRVDVIEEGDGAIARAITKTIEAAVTQRASDIHIEPSEHEVVVRIRVDGVLTEIAKYPASAGQGIINSLKVRAGLDVAERRLPQDGRITTTILDGRTLDLRLATVPTVWKTEGAVMRILDRSRGVASLAQLGYTAKIMATWERLAASPHGALLATGPTGSGKTTCLYATLAKIATNDVKVCTIEDPVEFRFPGLTQTQIDVKAGRTFPTVLRSFLRLDPDVILVGEIRDHDTALTAVEAALTGHLLLASLHANTAAYAPQRLIEMGVAPYLVASSIRGVLSQRLVRKLCLHCRTAVPTPVLVATAMEGIDVPAEIFEPVGCARCSGTGYNGRVAVAEILEVDAPMSAAIAMAAPHAEIVRLAKEGGMSTIFEEGLALVRAGITTIREVARVAN
jgi:type IV pilus assembly protein PilB